MDLVVEPLHGSCNPLEQDLILKLVLKHVGKANVTDLKNCRLVSHSWNRAAVQVLEQQHDYALELDLKNMDEFKNILWRTQLSRINSEHRELESLRLSFKLCSSISISEEETVEFVVGGASEMGKAGQMLQLNPQLRVAFMDYTCDANASEDTEPGDQEQSQIILVNQELSNLLNLTSTTLKSIEISYADLVCPHFEQFKFNSSLTFPSLTFLEYKMRNSLEEKVGGDEMLDLTKHVVSIIQGAPKLIALKLYFWDGDLEKTTNSLLPVMKGCADRLEELGFEINNENELDAFKSLSTEIKFPALRTITLTDGFYSTNKWFNLFLKTSCPALEGLHISWTFTNLLARHETSEEEEPMLFEFPRLPNILHFSLDLAYGSSSRYLDHVHATFSMLMKGLPSLKSCNLGLYVLFMLGAHLQRSGHLVPPSTLYPVFPSISTIEIIVDDDHAVGTIDFLDTAKIFYHHTFPSLRKLVIKPSSCCSSSSEEASGRAEIEFLCRHPGIQILEIQNYAKPWLDHLFSIGNQSLEGLKNLKLFAPETGAGPRLDPVQVVTRFPALEFIQFGKKIVSTTQIRSLRDVLKIFEDPISK